MLSALAATPVLAAAPLAATAQTAATPPATLVAHAGADAVLGFASSYDGEAFEGRFARFEARIAFDPATASGRFDVVIDLASAGTENDERDEVLLGPEFFDVGVLPQARYEATRFRKLADGRFVAEGTLQLRGVSQPVPLTFTWTAGATPVLEGEASVPRLAFGVGAGRDWRDTGLMPDAVTVRTRLRLQPAP
ncbi:MAG: YceI family protein [Xanthomonadaceae bacterium]|nr:YceI family protein [Xanthomonadaceae bacterium]